MTETFAELYASTLKDVFQTRASLDQSQGVDLLASAQSYAQRGKPDFVLAYLLLLGGEVGDEFKRDLLASAYERRAFLEDERAETFQAQFHRTFPLIKLEAQKDRRAAERIRTGQRLRQEGGSSPQLHLN